MTQSLRRRAAPTIVAALLWMCAGLQNGAAQIPGGLPATVEPGRDRPPLDAPAQPNFDFRIEMPGRSSVPRAIDEIHFRLNDIEVKGAVTLPASSFRAFYQPLIGKDVTLSDILDVAAAIENAYRQAGYILVRAFVPPQRVANGIFTINVVEGFISGVSIEGGTPRTRDHIRAYLEPARTARPLQLATVEQGLLLANDLPGVTAAGVLRPASDTPGASELVVTVPDAPLTGRLGIDNRGSRFSGIWSATGDLTASALLADDDQLEASATGALDAAPQRRASGELRYHRPIGDQGALLSLNGTITHGEPGSTLGMFHVLTDSWAAGPRLSFPLKRTRAETLVLEGGLTAQEAWVNLLDTPLTHDSWRVIDFGASYLRNGFLGAAWTANLDFAKGLPILGASDNGAANLSRIGARIDFAKLSGGASVTWQLPWQVDLVLAGQGQYAFDPLVVGEQVAFGGTGIGRGYDIGALIGDHGLGGTIEFRYDPQIAIPSVRALQPYLFLDSARVWDVNLPISQSINSVGGGIRAWLDHDIFGELEVVQTLEAIPGSDGGKRATKLLLNLSVGF